MDHAALKKLLHETVENPFLSEVVKSPWQPIIDAPLLHAKFKKKIGGVIKGADDPSSPRALVTVAEPGEGKSHLVAWVRQSLESKAGAVFVFVPPLQVDSVPLLRHMLLAALTSLAVDSPPQRGALEATLLGLLCSAYDDMAATKAGQAKLGAQLSLVQKVWGLPLLAERSRDKQRKELGRCIECADLLDRTFEAWRLKVTTLAERSAVSASTFNALCCHVLGREEHRDLAERWFRGEGLTEKQMARISVTKASLPLGDAPAAFHTLSSLTQKTLCFCFDQMEDTFQAMKATGSLEQAIREFSSDIMVVYGLPAVCILMFWQEAQWHQFSARSTVHLNRRLLEGHGLQHLDPPDRLGAKDLVLSRMRHYAWDPRPDLDPPDENPLFPFVEEDIDRLLEGGSTTVAEIIKRARALYDERLRGSASAPPDMNAYPLFQKDRDHGPVGEGAPPIVTGQEDAGVVTGQEHDSEEQGVPRPLREHIDGMKLREQRGKLTQKEVASQVGLTQPQISAIELNKEKADDRYEALAKFYGVPLSSLLKDSP